MTRPPFALIPRAALATLTAITVAACASSDPGDLGFDSRTAQAPYYEGGYATPGEVYTYPAEPQAPQPYSQEVLAYEQAAFPNEQLMTPGIPPQYAQAGNGLGPRDVRAFYEPDYADQQELITAQRLAGRQEQFAEQQPRGDFFQRYQFEQPVMPSSTAFLAAPQAQPAVIRSAPLPAQPVYQQAPVVQQRPAAPVISSAPVRQAQAMPVRQDVVRQPLQVADAPVQHSGLLPSGPITGDVAVSGLPAMPPAIPGQCFALVKKPETYRRVRQQVVTKPATQRIVTTPPQYTTEMREVITRPAYEQLSVVPAQFRQVSERVQVKPETVQYVSTPPQYQTVTERVMVRPARTVWKPGRGPIERLDNATGEIMCLVEEPAQYQTYTKQVVAQPGGVREVRQPAQFQQVTRTVVAEPARVERVSVPAQTARVPVQRLVKPAGQQTVAVPAEYGTVERHELVEPARLEWRPVLCQTNITPAVIQQIQSALASQGFNPGPIDGVIGQQTIAAMNAFQRSRGLPVDRYLNIETVRALGVRV